MGVFSQLAELRHCPQPTATPPPTLRVQSCSYSSIYLPAHAYQQWEVLVCNCIYDSGYWRTTSIRLNLWQGPAQKEEDQSFSSFCLDRRGLSERYMAVCDTEIKWWYLNTRHVLTQLEYTQGSERHFADVPCRLVLPRLKLPLRYSA